jgi:polysaccharide biosynthesis transport protein
VVVPDPSMQDDARATMSEQLRAVGFSDVTMLSRPASSAGTIETVPAVVAA